MDCFCGKLWVDKDEVIHVSLKLLSFIHSCLGLSEGLLKYED